MKSERKLLKSINITTEDIRMRALYHIALTLHSGHIHRVLEMQLWKIAVELDIEELPEEEIRMIFDNTNMIRMIGNDIQKFANSLVKKEDEEEFIGLVRGYELRLNKDLLATGNKVSNILEGYSKELDINNSLRAIDIDW